MNHGLVRTARLLKRVASTAILTPRMVISLATIVQLIIIWIKIQIPVRAGTPSYNAVPV